MILIIFHNLISTFKKLHNYSVKANFSVVTQNYVLNKKKEGISIIKTSF